MDARNHKIEGSSKRRRDEDDTNGEARSYDLAVPRNRMHMNMGVAQDKSEYQHGSIIKVSMRSFVTYESCSFTPGPNLNMIIGPNGTGKSTIVCALALGLGWNTNLLGRAKDISEFVKHGSDKGWVEIVLCNKNGANVVIKRHINKNNNTSVWKINGENKTQKEVMKKVQSFDIQVDNLCQFLPQDRVAEFAQMTPQELLRETQRAVGGEDMLNAHNKMIELWNEHKTIAASVKGDLESIETNEKRNAVIEKDVFRFQQREAVLRKVRLLEIWILYAKYGLAKDEYNAVKESRRVTFAMLKQLQTEVEPLEKKRRKVEQDERTCNEQKNVLERHYQKSIHTLKAKGTTIEAAEGDGDELRKDLERLHAKGQQRQAAINSIKRKIVAQRELIESALPNNEIDKEKEALNEKINALVEETRGTKDRIEYLQSKQTEIVEESKRINGKMVQNTKRVDALDDIRNRRLEQLGRSDRHVYQAVLWLRQNRHLFKKHVFEPVCLELNIKNMNIVNVVENVLRNHLKTREDYNILTRELLDNKHLRVNVIAPRPNELELDSYRPPIQPHQLQQFGFDGYLLDAVDGPPALLAALCSKSGLHAIPYTGGSDLDNQAVRMSKLFRKYATATTIFSISYSRHTNEPMDTASQVRQAQVFTASVDHEERAQLIRDIDNMRATLEANELKIREFTMEENNLRRHFQESATRRDALNRQKKELSLSQQQAERRKLDLEKLVRELDRKEREPSSEEEEEKIRSALRRLASKRCKYTVEYLELAKESQRLFSQLTMATLNRLHAHAELQAIEAECTEKARQLKEMEDQYAEVNAQYDEVKGRAKELLDKAKEEYNTLQPQDVAEFQELGKGVPLEQLEDMHAGESAKAALHYTPNQSVIDKYEQRQGEIQAAKGKVEAKQKKMDKIAAEIHAIRSPWYSKITSLIAEISKGFSDSFQRIGCAGEVKLGEHEDYDKWCIEILVKFRDEEKLQKLTGQRQSGGERSVSTIMYLMALQSLSKVSFRVVDEINQGMDPRNERMVHAQLVEKACKANTAQYFLITPKLLPNLDYHERMKVLCIYNGEWLDEGVTKWTKYLDNQLRSKARRL
ncbi:Structural maintenance of chromosomes protein 5 [Haplosporangium sp. Z 767]|nr:Structural maintenance of chromosomes protein 5 [Haplosporangium sp. Z 11]KAF9185762.1 Structural maintenance of chromosomes protein 5 [Haplosporangium sp. Z 767]